jgi:hypothetical protein
MAAREAACAKVVAETGATLVPPYGEQWQWGATGLTLFDRRLIGADLFCPHMSVWALVETIDAEGPDCILPVLHAKTQGQCLTSPARHPGPTLPSYPLPPCLDYGPVIAGQGTIGLEFLEQVGPAARCG